MNLLNQFWEWLLIADNRETVQALGAGLVVVIAGLWRLYVHFQGKKDRNPSNNPNSLSSSGSPMNKIKLFLASSSELKADRQQFELFIGRKNKSWVDKGIFLELVIWEDFLDAVSQTRLQDEYNHAIKGCDVFVMLFFTKVGKYTEEEFETAFGQFKGTNKPFIFTYFKDAAISTAELNDDVLSLLQFKKKLKELGHFFTAYKNIEDLLLQFGQQLDKLAESGYIEFKPDITGSTGISHSKNVVSHSPVNTGGGAFVVGDGNQVK